MSEDRLQWTEQNIQNFGLDVTVNPPVSTRGELTYDGVNWLRGLSSIVAMKITVSGTTLYVAIAPVGTLQSAAAWQCKKIVQGTDITITWAGGGKFTQVATDLTALTYA